jgi:hypothetical protein
MPGKITELAPPLTAAGAAANDLIEVVDVSDTTMASSGTNKPMSLSEMALYVAPMVRDTGVDIGARRAINFLNGASTTARTQDDAANNEVEVWFDIDTSNLVTRPMYTTKGDVLAASGATTPVRLPVGANNTVLTADSAETVGLRWATTAPIMVRKDDLDVAARPALNFYAGLGIQNTVVDGGDEVAITIACNSAVLTQSEFDAKGDLLVGTADNARTRLAAGTNYQALMSDSAAAYGVKWSHGLTVPFANEAAVNTWAPPDGAWAWAIAERTKWVRIAGAWARYGTTLITASGWGCGSVNGETTMGSLTVPAAPYARSCTINFTAFVASSTSTSGAVLLKHSGDNSVLCGAYYWGQGGGGQVAGLHALYLGAGLELPVYMTLSPSGGFAEAWTDVQVSRIAFTLSPQ